MKFLIHSSLALLALAALNSCSSRLSEAELAAISTVSVPKAPFAPASYKHPSVFEYRADGRSPHDGVGLMGGLIGMTAADNDLAGYLIGEMVGDAVGHGIAANEKTTFQKNYGTYYSSLRGKVPSDLTSMVTKRVEAQVKANPFFGLRLKDQGRHQFSVRIKHHFLSRNGSDPRNQQPLMSAYVQLEVALYGPGLRALYTGTYLGKSRIAMDIPTLASSKFISRDAFREAVNDACKKFADELRTKSGR
ncbi:MAG: hypothetical protein H8E96_03045 [Verrucomicrobiaceae bacterium]|nr:hypothetical protein [Verrucomicrobiaceae bacterium]